MDYAALAPEINSARMYAGPGNGPLLAAGSGWDTLASELAYAAAGYTAIIAEMTSGKWRGPAAAAMAAAATLYANWMGTTATQALEAAGQARAAAGAYETAFALTVPPPVIAANRAHLATLKATNLLGQNTPAIAATETHYAEMMGAGRHRDVRLCGLVGGGVGAHALRRGTADHQRRSRLSQGVATVDAGTQGRLLQLVSTIPDVLQGLSTPLGAESMVNWLGLAGTDLSAPAGVLNFLDRAYGSALGGALSSVGLNALSSGFYTAGNFLGTLADAVGMAGVGGAVEAGSEAVEAAVGEVGASVQSLGGAMTAGAGNAAAVGTFSVPPSWTAAASPLGSALSTLPEAGIAATPTAEGPASMLGGLPFSPPVRSRLWRCATLRLQAQRRDAPTGRRLSRYRGGMPKAMFSNASRQSEDTSAASALRSAPRQDSVGGTRACAFREIMRCRSRSSHPTLWLRRLIN